MEKRSSFSRAWWWPSDCPRIRIESRVDSVSFMNTWLATAWPASWIATARVSSGTYSMLIAVPDSTVVIASKRSSNSNPGRPSWWAIVSAIEQTCSIIAGEYPLVMRASSSRAAASSRSGSCETLSM